MEYIEKNYGPKHHNHYKSIFEKNYLQQGINSECDEALDISSGILMSIYRDKTYLPLILEIIFKRHKKGLFINNLIWAFFQCGDPESLELISKHLISKDYTEHQLSKKLLSFIPEIKINCSRSQKELYLMAQNWIKENRIFLYFTGESFQQTSEPKPFKVNYFAKYLSKPVYHNTGKIIEKLTAKEIKLSEKFDDLNDSSKELMSKFSFNLYTNNKYWWTAWLDFPFEKQKKLAFWGDEYD